MANSGAFGEYLPLLAQIVLFALNYGYQKTWPLFL